MPKRPAKKKDANETAAALVRGATGTKRVRLSELLDSPELRKKYRVAKARMKESRVRPTKTKF